ncbi:ATPase [Legionella fallonii]|uniref:Predicted ATPases involved in biogenesis of archaeal flagella n=1 Tax=Legionella fallonii LLAP-10 TaxID=1212491 RepID=A0A098G7Z9_9GAMM|nr:ATPase [Legionella fallonii]CEG58578.1 Predicted ATPases involved in biogenesis of archaeal flagella [Legionella fallonii LLAP-10]
MNHFIRTAFLFLLLLFSSHCGADTLVIKVNQNPIDLSYWPAGNKHYGAVLLISGGEDVVQSPILLTHVAEQLSSYGWSVVLLNCTKDSPVPWVKQIPPTINILREHKNKRIVLVHYGEQLNQSLEYFSRPQSKMINGLIMLSAYDDTNWSKLKKLRFPVFDIAGQFDYDAVLYQMEVREKEFGRHNYQSIEMPGAHHDYRYSQKMLLAFIHGWMAKLPESEPEPPPILVSYIEPVYSAASHIAKVDHSDWAGFIDDPIEPE